MELDVEVVEYTEKVQKGRSCAANWTLKRRNAQSPKGKKLHGELDVEIVEYKEEVQKERSGAVNWTLKRRKGAQKSKRRKYVHGNSRQAGVCSHRLRLSVSLAAYAIARSGACTRGSLAVIAIITSALAGCAVSIKSVGAVIHARFLAVFL